MRRLLSTLAIFGFASVGTAAPACSIRGIADGVRPVVSDGGNEDDTGTGAGDAACGADLTRDKANCGRCGRACSGACEDGTCDVTTILDGQPVPIASLATNGKYVAWGAGRGLRACPVAGCTKASVFFDGRDLTGQLAVYGDALVYSSGVTSDHGVGRCTLPDCNDDVSLGFDLGTPTAVAADADVFALETTGRRVLRCAGADCFSDVAKNTSADGAIALGLSSVYWSVLGASGAIYTCPRSGCPGGSAALFAPSQATARALAVDLHDVVWTSYEGGTVSSCPLASCGAGPTVLASGQKNPLGVASDGARVYWVNEGDGTVVTCDASGCVGAPHVLVRSLDRPQWVALDGTHVYFATAGGVIGRTPK